MRRECKKKEKCNCPSMIYKRSKDAIVSLTSFFEGLNFFIIGSGFFISRDGYIVTSAHLVLNPTRDISAINIWAGVTNVNGDSGVSRVYQCKLIGVDGSADIAVLKILSGEGYQTPKINNHPYLKFGCSRHEKPGNTAYVIGYPLASDLQSFTKGVIRDPNYLNVFGDVPVETMLTDCDVQEGDSGAPVLDKCGRVIGLISYTYLTGPDENAPTETMNAGASQYIIEQVVHGIISGNQAQPVNDYLYYDKGFIGIETALPMTMWRMISLYPQNTPINIQGMIITGIRAGSPIDGILQLADVIIEVDYKKIGILEDQVPIGSVTWFKKPGDRVIIKYMRPPSTEVKIVEIILDPYPANLDYLFSAGSGVEYLGPLKIKKD